MKSYLITFALGRDRDVSQDAMKNILASLETMHREGEGYQHVEGAFIAPSADGVSFALSANERALFALMSDVYAALRRQEWGMSFSLANEDGLPQVTLYGGPAIVHDQSPAGFAQYVAAEEVFVSMDVFIKKWTCLFGGFDEEPAGSEGDAAYETVSVPATVPSLFALPLLAGAEHQAFEELILILPDPDLSIEAVMGGIVGTASAEQIDEAHLMLIDCKGETRAEALAMNSDRGPVIELRIYVPDPSNSALLGLLAERAAPLTRSAALLVVAEDFETFNFEVRPLKLDGTLGRGERIVFNLD
ncbi:MAG: hypothetical protein JJ901_03215 [Erythrobacter sp.]|uniref:hypothetical protein n=1 Tax=Erythrobacter sp. TaxID=1042 RepID=UPI001AFE96F0|nr:hypothetical protein [Erythrobacter sp.]MBO6767299.1 hypothetical protein [Erythrobacter sp.]